MNLVLVESPTKARTLSRFLGKDYIIEATYGHLRDLPQKKLGVDIKSGFKPEYVIVAGREKRVKELRSLAKKSKKIILATDLDREGEAIAYHVAFLLGRDSSGGLAQTYGTSKKLSPSESKGGFKSRERFNRIVFHEITKSAIEKAVQNPRKINMNLVNAQQGRRILDRLVGYKLSPLLWKKVRSGLSAGRVQSVVVRIIVDREREREAFVPEEYWNIEVTLQKFKVQNAKFKVKLEKIDGKRAEVKNEKEAARVVAHLKVASFIVDNVEKKEVKKQPYPPFKTSTLQQTAARLLRWSGKKTMMHAQKLYERGFITYHRTDSVSLATEAVSAARKYIEKEYGKKYLPKTARVFKTKSKLAQEAHEAIRPTNVVKSGKLKVKSIGRDDLRLYDLIWKRFVACQMAAAVFKRTKIEVLADSSGTNFSSVPNSPPRRTSGSPADSSSKQSSLSKSNSSQVKAVGGSGLAQTYVTSKKLSPSEFSSERNSKKYLLIARGEIEKFDGWRKIFRSEKEDREQQLPEVAKGEKLKFVDIDPQQKFTQPPARYSEASLIKKLEAAGIGRPSTYAPIISTIQDRHYVEKEEGKFLPTNLGFAVNDFLVENFSDIVDLAFTARMEEDLDEIINAKHSWQEVLGKFYKPFEKKLKEVTKTAQKVKVPVEKLGEKCPDCKKGELIIRVGKFGKFIACEAFPKCKYSRNYVEKAGLDCPKCSGEVIVKRTRKGKRFYGCINFPDCDFAAWKKNQITRE